MLRKKSGIDRLKESGLDLLKERTGVDVGRSFSRASGRVANTFNHSRNHPWINGRGSAKVFAAAAGIAGAYAAMRYFRRGNGADTAFDVYPSEQGGWMVRTSETFATRSQALDVARRATDALRVDPVGGRSLGTPESSVRRPWSGQPESSPSTDGAY